MSGISPERKAAPTTHAALGGLGVLRTERPAPSSQDARAAVLIERAAAQLRAWHAKYGEHQPGWLPPAGDVRWLEDAADFLAGHGG